MGNGVVSKSQSHPTADVLVKVTLPYFTTDFNTFLENVPVIFYCRFSMIFCEAPLSNPRSVKAQYSWRYSNYERENSCFFLQT